MGDVPPVLNLRNVLPLLEFLAEFQAQHNLEFSGFSIDGGLVIASTPSFDFDLCLKLGKVCAVSSLLRLVDGLYAMKLEINILLSRFNRRVRFNPSLFDSILISRES